MCAVRSAPALCHASPEDSLIYLISQAQQIQQLLASLRLVSRSELLLCVAAAAADASSWPRRVTPIPERDGLVCDLVLEATARDQDPSLAPDNANDDGKAVLSALQHCIFGGQLQHVPFIKLVYSQSFEQALQAQRACGLLLEAAVSPANCFLLLQLGRCQGLHHLEARALDTAMSSFSQAFRLDRAGFESLPEEVLVNVLASDNLDVDNELGVFIALARWILADRERRLPLFHNLFVRCVRLGCMNRAELFQLDQHPLVASCPEAMKLAALAYLGLCYGTSVPGESGGCLCAGRGRRRHADAADRPAENGRLTPLIRTAKALDHPGQDMGSLLAAAAAAQPGPFLLAGGGPVDVMGTGTQQAVAGVYTAMQEASPGCTGQEHVDDEPLQERAVQQLGHCRLAGEPGCSSTSSRAVSAARTTGDVGREDEEQKRVLPPMAMECTQSPNGRSQTAPSDAPGGSCRPSSCRRLRFVDLW